MVVTSECEGELGAEGVLRCEEGLSPFGDVAVDEDQLGEILLCHVAVFEFIAGPDHLNGV